jgi:hypothetical protein
MGATAFLARQAALRVHSELLLSLLLLSFMSFVARHFEDARLSALTHTRCASFRMARCVKLMAHVLAA